MRSAVRDDLDCDELVEVVTEYLEGALPPVERTRFEHHLVWCAGCTAHLQQVRATRRLAGRIGGAVPPEVQARLLSAFRAWKGEGGAR